MVGQIGGFLPGIYPAALTKGRPVLGSKIPLQARGDVLPDHGCFDGQSTGAAEGIDESPVRFPAAQ